MVILCNFKFLEVKPSKFHCILQASNAIQDRTLIGTSAITSISEWHELNFRKWLPSLLSSFIKYYHLCLEQRYLPTADQQGSIRIFFKLGGSLMIKNIILIFVVVHNFGDLSCIFIDLGEVQRSKILIEGVIL